MKIKNIHLKKIAKNPDAFSHILSVMNTGDSEKTTPLSLADKFKRKSAFISTHFAVVDYLRQEGYSDNEIFE